MPGKCSKEGLLTQLKDLVRQIDDGECKQNKCCSGCPQPACCEQPFAQVCFTCPPCIPLPTVPCPVKPLQLPCPNGGSSPQAAISEEREAYNSRYDNFYNNYNIDYRAQALVHRDNGSTSNGPSDRNYGVTVDGKNPRCEDYMAQRRNGMDEQLNKGCPTGFKPCTMQLFPPQCCNPIGVWGAHIMPCPTKPPKPEHRLGRKSSERGKRLSNVNKNGDRPRTSTRLHIREHEEFCNCFFSARNKVRSVNLDICQE